MIPDLSSLKKESECIILKRKDIIYDFTVEYGMIQLLVYSEDEFKSWQLGRGDATT